MVAPHRQYVRCRQHANREAPSEAPPYRRADERYHAPRVEQQRLARNARNRRGASPRAAPSPSPSHFFCRSSTCTHCIRHGAAAAGEASAAVDAAGLGNVQERSRRRRATVEVEAPSGDADSTARRAASSGSAAGSSGCANPRRGAIPVSSRAGASQLSMRARKSRSARARRPRPVTTGTRVNVRWRSSRQSAEADILFPSRLDGRASRRADHRMARRSVCERHARRRPPSTPPAGVEVRTYAALIHSAYLRARPRSPAGGDDPRSARLEQQTSAPLRREDESRQELV